MPRSDEHVRQSGGISARRLQGRRPAQLRYKDVDLTKVNPGDGITVQLTEAVAILVEKS
jgi:hypothetical protein